MPTPRTIDYKTIFRRVNDALALESKGPMPDDTKADVRDHIAGAIKYVESIPGLNHHYKKLTDDDVAEVAYKYALALAKGNGVDMDGVRLDAGYLTKQLTTVPPPVAKEPVPPPAPAKPAFGHLLDNPHNMNILHAEVLQVAKRPGPEQLFAQVLAEQFKTAAGRADIVRLYKALDVMTTLDSTHKVSDFATDDKAMKEFWNHLSPTQRGLLVSFILEDDRWRINPKRWLWAKEPGGMTRRAAIGTIGATILGWMAWSDHDHAHRQSDQAIGIEGQVKDKGTKPVTDTKQRPARPGDADFFGEDPREVVMRPENKEKLQAAIRDDRVALGEAIGAATLALFAATHAIRRVTVKFSKEVRDGAQAGVAGADGIAYRTKEKIRQADVDDGRSGPAT